MQTDEFYRTLCPIDPYEVLEWRQWLVKKCWEDDDFAKDVREACRRDLLFWINSFGFLLEPRHESAWKSGPFGNAKVIPFITREYQDDALLKMQANLGRKDVLILKSRETGATWMVLYLFDWQWRFHAESHLGLVSKDEDSADSDNPDSLMAKLQFIDDKLPRFLQPGGSSARFRNHLRNQHTLVNRANGSTIAGYSCTADMARGGRKLAFFMDEMHAWSEGHDRASMASTQHVTPCRIMCSTPNPQRGQSGQFFDLCEAKHSDVERITLHWSMDKEKAAGLYTSEGNKVQILDALYPYRQDYPFILDGKVRSPYYDHEWRRAGATPRSIATELDMDFGGATNRLFDGHVIAIARGRTRKADFRARLKKHQGCWMSVLEEDEHGEIEFWVPDDMQVDMDDSGIVTIPQGRRFSMGCDVSRGAGGLFSSCSAAVIIDQHSGKQVAEWRSAHFKPVEFAELAFFLGKFFNTAMMNPEITGPGLEFIERIMEMGYMNFWYRPRTKGAVFPRMSDKPGFDNRDGGLMLLGELQDALKRERVKIYSPQVINECERYFIDETGKLRHPLVGKGRVDAPERSHGDSAIACAAAWWAIHEQTASPIEEDEVQVPYGGFLWRRNLVRPERPAGVAAWSPLESKEHKIKVW